MCCDAINGFLSTYIVKHLVIYYFSGSQFHVLQLIMTLFITFQKFLRYAHKINKRNRPQKMCYTFQEPAVRSYRPFYEEISKIAYLWQ